MKRTIKSITTGIMVIASCTILLGINQAAAQSKKVNKMKKVLFVVTYPFVQVHSKVTV